MTKNFINLSLVSIFLIIAVNVTSIYITRSNLKNNMQLEVGRNASMASKSISQALNRTEQMIHYMIANIKQKPDDMEYINNVIMEGKKNTTSYGISVIGWLDKDNNMRVYSDIGIVNGNNTTIIRNYLKHMKSVITPGKMHITAMDINGQVTNDQMISVAIGVEINSKYIGSIIAGIKTQSILRFVTNTIQSELIKFALATNDKSAIVYLAQDSNVFGKGVQDLVISGSSNIGEHPYQVIAAYDIKKRQAFDNSIIFNIIVSLISTLMIIIVFYILFHAKNIAPVINTINAIEQSRNGQCAVKWTQYKLKEFRIIAENVESTNKYRNEIKKLEKECTTYKEKLEKAQKAKNDFMSKISHELKTPLNIIMALSELIIKKTENNSDIQLKEHYKDIYYSGKKLFYAIDDILHTTTEIKSNKTMSKTNLNKMIENITDCFKDDIEKKQISLYKFIDNKIKIFVNIESTEKALWHIISNAVKFTPTKGEISINFSINQKDQTITLSIRDSGIGMNREQVRMAYEEFYQGDDGITRKFDGIGLGLSLAKKLLEAQNISIKISSAQFIGTHVQITIPIFQETLSTNKQTVENV